MEAKNSRAAVLNPTAENDKIRNEVEAGRVEGPFIHPSLEIC